MDRLEYIENIAVICLADLRQTKMRSFSKLTGVARAFDIRIQQWKYCASGIWNITVRIYTTLINYRVHQNIVICSEFHCLYLPQAYSIFLHEALFLVIKVSASARVLTCCVLDNVEFYARSTSH